MHSGELAKDATSTHNVTHLITTNRSAELYLLHKN